MAREATGTLIYTKAKGWCARVPVIVGYVDGKPVRDKKWYELGRVVDGVYVPLHGSKTLAKRKLASIVAADRAGKTPTQAEVSAPETTADAIDRIVRQQGVDGLKTWNERLARLNRYAVPHLGHTTIDKLRPSHVNEMLEAAKKAGLARQSVVHLRNDLLGVFGALWRAEVIAENPVEKSELPKKLKRDKRKRVVPLDAEFAHFMACPDVSEELHLKALTSRCLGGQRTSDLHAWDWSHVDTKTFVSAKVYRPKTDDEEGASAELEEIVIPDELRNPLIAWWTRWKRPGDDGGPTSGPVFPVMHGKHAGERQGKRSHARELRAAFWAAGVHRPLPGFEEALAAMYAAEERLRRLSDKGEGRPAYRAALQALSAATDAAQALDAIQTDTPKTRRLDFHSLRRSYNTALAAAGVNIQTAMALAGHRNEKTHMRYVHLAQLGPLTQPQAALPKLGAPVDRTRRTDTSNQIVPSRGRKPPEPSSVVHYLQLGAGVLRNSHAGNAGSIPAGVTQNPREKSGESAPGQIDWTRFVSDRPSPPSGGVAGEPAWAWELASGLG